MFKSVKANNGEYIGGFVDLRKQFVQNLKIQETRDKIFS